MRIAHLCVSHALTTADGTIVWLEGSGANILRNQTVAQVLKSVQSLNRICGKVDNSRYLCTQKGFEPSPYLVGSPFARLQSKVLQRAQRISARPCCLDSFRP